MGGAPLGPGVEPVAASVDGADAEVKDHRDLDALHARDRARSDRWSLGSVQVAIDRPGPPADWRRGTSGWRGRVLFAAFDTISEGMQLYPPGYLPGRGIDFLYFPSRLSFAAFEANGDFTVYRGESPEDPGRVVA